MPVLEKNNFTGKKLAVIAGSGELPKLCLTRAKELGMEVLTIAIKNQQTKEVISDLKENSSNFLEIYVGKFGKLLKILKQNNVDFVTLAGGVNKSSFFSLFAFDLKALSLLKSIVSTGDDKILRAVTEEISKTGAKIIGTAEILPELLLQEGLLTKRDLTEQEKLDAKIGIDAFKTLGKLDVGQALSVNKGSIIAVEGVEGTDNLIKRSGGLINFTPSIGFKNGIVIVKFSKPGQDLRVDIPTIGPETIRNMKKSKATALVLEANKTQMIKPDEVIREADKAGIAIKIYNNQ